MQDQPWGTLGHGKEPDHVVDVPDVSADPVLVAIAEQARAKGDAALQQKRLERIAKEDRQARILADMLLDAYRAAHRYDSEERTATLGRMYASDYEKLYAWLRRDEVTWD